ncbi:Repeat domain-containing protein [Ruegeria halocynthiae]|uniref:Repeat domain-containing protein n=1 Tax=Ruegeria halocynthiae TaxID=985054 RepID=A0A1H2UIQ0_9RHOB|nr:VCBS repeat-containing protein [Ruegeria halocynthiae]SDW55965.1 Repeat domain-containing protein [Ruegeria halocynthiae]
MSGISPALSDDTVVSARFIEPTTRYAHGVLGDAIEFGALEINLKARTMNKTSQAASDRFSVTIRLPQDRVFEDLAPRLMDVDQDGVPEIIVVESHQHAGAQLAIYNAKGHKIAATPHIGTRFRWLAPIGAADLDGDGHVEIAYVDRPHLAKTLRIWRYQNTSLTEIATLPGLTNHRIGEDFISGGLRLCNSTPELILASADWSRIISITYNKGWQQKDLGPLHSREDLTAASEC